MLQLVLTHVFSRNNVQFQPQLGMLLLALVFAISQISYQLNTKHGIKVLVLIHVENRKLPFKINKKVEAVAEVVKIKKAALVAKVVNIKKATVKIVVLLGQQVFLHMMIGDILHRKN